MGGGSFIPTQGFWRWYADAAGPTTPLANENVKPALSDGSIIRLRVCIKETGGANGTGAWVVQYREGTGGTWTNLGAANHWNWANGADTEGGASVFGLLSDTNSNGQYIETSSYSSSVSKSKNNEFDLAVQPTGNETASTDYYFRVLTIGGTSVGAGASEPVVTTAAGGGGFQSAWAKAANPQGVIS